MSREKSGERADAKENRIEFQDFCEARELKNIPLKSILVMREKRETAVETKLVTRQREQGVNPTLDQFWSLFSWFIA